MPERPSGRTARRALVVNHGAELYGSDRMLLESVRALRADDWAVTVSLPDEGELADLMRAAGADVEFLAVPSIGRNLLSPKGLLAFIGGSLRALPKQIGMIRRSKADLVYVNTLTLPSWALAGRLVRRRVMCHVHEAERSASRALQLLLAAPLALSQRLIANSRTTMETISGRPFGYLRRRSVVVPNGVTGPSRTQDPRPTIDGPLRLLYVGRLSRRKGPHVAVEAVRRLRESGIEVTLSLLGAVFEGYEWYADELREQIAAAGLDDNVTMLGFRPDVWQVVADHDVVLVPSTTDESFGNTAIEGVLARRPVVCSEIPGLRESAGMFDAVAFARPDDPAELSERIREIRTDWPAWRERAIASAAQAEEEYSTDRYHDRIAAAAESA